ncbi:MAG: trigger factor [Clostridioides sp.]|nr:trigger factor [Clostridioides sp.]
MKAELIKKEGNKVNLKITVDNANFEKAVEKAYKQNRGKYNVPGFRKGKAPRVILETQFGKGIFYNDAVEILFPEVYPEAIKELELDPIDSPDLDIEEISKDNGIVMILNVEVKPEFELGNYKGLEIKKADDTVKDTEIEVELNKMLENNARIISMDDKIIENGDTAVIDFEGFDGDVAFEGGKGENHHLVIGSEEFIPGFEEQLVGKKAGEEVEVNVTFPEQYHVEELAGKPVVFKVAIKDVKVKELAELDDEFAKDVSEFDTLEELKKDISEKLAVKAKERAEMEIRNEVVIKAAETTEVDVPEAMVNRQIDSMLQNLNYQLQMQGFGLEMLLNMTGKTIDDLKDDRREEAQRIVKNSLVLEAISDKEEISASQEEIDAEIQTMADMYKMKVEEIKGMLRPEDMDDVENQIRMRNTIDFLLENAKLN